MRCAVLDMHGQNATEPVNYPAAHGASPGNILANGHRCWSGQRQFRTTKFYVSATVRTLRPRLHITVTGRWWNNKPEQGDPDLVAFVIKRTKDGVDSPHGIGPRPLLPRLQ